MHSNFMDVVRARSDRAIASGDLKPIVAEQAVIQDRGLPFTVRWVAALAAKDAAAQDAAAGKPASTGNPAVTLPGQSFVVPADRASQLQEGLAELDEEDGSWRIHRLAKGETLQALAARHGISHAQLLKLNGLASGSQPAPGYALLVPDGVDPDGALEVVSLLPLRAALVRPQGLKLNAPSKKGGATGLKSPRSQPRNTARSGAKRKAAR